jgi:hypothetical protein
VTADTSIVQFIMRGNLVTLDIRPSSESGFSQYGSGTGSVTAQLVFDFPTATGGTGQMEFYAIDGCCVLGALGVPSFPGGAVKETITATTVAIIPLGGPNFDALEQVDSTYTSAFGSGSSHFLGESSGPFQLLEFTRPEFVQIPEPTTVWLLAPALLGLLVNRSLIKNR